MAIINPLPYNIANGDPVDATPVMADLNQIVANVNANAAPVAGSASQEFLVASTTNPAGAVPLVQAQSQFAPISGSTVYAATSGSSSQVFNVANATTSTEAVSLGQAQAAFAAFNGSASQVFNVANATTPSEAVNLGQMIGGGATQYANVTGSRALSATYTNTTGRPLVVCVVGEALVNLSALCELNGYVDGNLSMVSSIVNSTGSASTTFYPSIMLIVPPGGTYSASATASVIIFKWLEY